jgi:hypothetical protein
MSVRMRGFDNEYVVLVGRRKHGLRSNIGVYINRV